MLQREFSLNAYKSNQVFIKWNLSINLKLVKQVTHCYNIV